MKKFIALNLGLFMSISVFANTNTQWPKVEYPTFMIGQFIGFCVNTLNNRASVYDQEAVAKNPQGVMQAHTVVCSCIMDSFRKENSEFTFKIEWEAANSQEVPYFKKYLSECTSINNQLQLLNSGT
jgi:hypothetical protein